MEILAGWRRSTRMRGGGRVWFVLLGLATTGFTSHCYQPTFIDYQFRLSGRGLNGFTLPDTASEGRLTLSAASPLNWARCPAYRAYDLVLHRSGYDDLGQGSVYIGLDHRSPAMLHVVTYVDSADTQPMAIWATKAAQLITKASMVHAIVPPDSALVIGKIQKFKEWCRQAEAGN